MKTCTATLKSAAPYSQSRSIERFVPGLEKEGKDAYEKRTWREKAHVDKNGMVIIPGMAFKMALDAGAKFMSIKIPGERSATYTKNFKAGVLVLDEIPLGIHRDDTIEEWIYANSDGVRGSGKRVWRCFPRIDAWQVEVKFYIADEKITKPVFESVLAETGKFVGIGRFRPANGGFYGRFEVVKTAWGTD